MRSHWRLYIPAMILCWGISARGGLAASIDTTFLEQPWSEQRVDITEVGRYAVKWRQWAGGAEGIFAGVQVTVPLRREALWDVSTDYTDIGHMTPGVQAVRVLEESPTRQVIQLDIRILWKILQLRFEIEQDPPEAIRFRLFHEAVGEYRGVVRLVDLEDDDAQTGTSVQLSTWLRPARRR